MNKPINIFKEPVLNEHGIQEFVITPVNDYYSIKYTVSHDNHIHSHDLYTEYGEDMIIKEFIEHMNYLLSTHLMHEYHVLDVYVYSYEKVDYRRNIEGETYTSYDLYRYKVNSDLKDKLNKR